MPRGDGTGPFGTYTNCVPPGADYTIVGRGRMRKVAGRGRRAPGIGGRGRGNMFRFLATGIPGYAVGQTREQQLENLRAQQEAIGQKISELEKE